jgi:hypothetical protein
MKKIIVMLFAGFSFFGYSQNYNINLRFDAVYTALYGPIYNVISGSNNINAQGTLTWDKTKLYEQVGGVYTSASLASQSDLGSVRSGALEALLRMYEITCDQKYLYEFMEQATHIINMRADKVSPQQSASPYLFVNTVQFHGRILHPLAHFVHLIRSKNLGSVIIPLVHRVNFNNKATFGEYSDALNSQNREMMDHLVTQFWRSGDECMCKPAWISETGSNCITKTGDNAIMEMNFQAPFGNALIYLYLANTNEVSYGSKVVQMARAYLGTHGTVLIASALNNSYSWYHSGWQKGPSGGLRNSFVEDIGHGAFDIQFPILYNKYYSSFTGTITNGQYFEDYQMVRFRNAFTKKIYQQPATTLCVGTNSSFACNLDGNCIDNSSPNTPVSYQMNAKAWTGLYKFDYVSGAQSGLGVYDIMMDYYQKVESCLPINDGNYGGVSIVNLADLAVANYDRANVLCSVSQPRSKISIHVSPNPGKDIMEISFDDEDRKITQIQVYDLAGSKIFEDVNTELVNTSKLKEGVYILYVIFDNGSQSTEKIIVRN